MSGSRKISELTTASVPAGTELLPIVQDGETRQTTVDDLMVRAPVQSVNGMDGVVILSGTDLGLDSLTANGQVSAAITSVMGAVTSVQSYVLAQISIATSGGILEAPLDGQVYGRASGNWTPVSVTAIQTQVNAVSVVTSTLQVQVNAVSVLTSALQVQVNTVSAAASVNAAAVSAATVALQAMPYDIAFDCGVTTVPQGEYARIVAVRNFYILPSCSNSQISIFTSAFPTAIVSIPIMFPTSVTLGVLLIGTSGTATWPAITTTSIAPGQSFGIQTSVSADTGLKGLTITFAGYARLV